MRCQSNLMSLHLIILCPTDISFIYEKWYKNYFLLTRADHQLQQWAHFESTLYQSGLWHGTSLSVRERVRQLPIVFTVQMFWNVAATEPFTVQLIWGTWKKNASRNKGIQVGQYFKNVNNFCVCYIEWETSIRGKKYISWKATLKSLELTLSLLFAYQIQTKMIFISDRLLSSVLVHAMSSTSLFFSISLIWSMALCRMQRM